MICGRVFRRRLALTRGGAAPTSEPPGGRGLAKSTRLRFVIQRHAARRLHYDLRLELDGAFKSWAVTRGPPLAPGDKRLAVEVEDHPLEYGDFEGTIPQGEYGGGTVQLWDRGYWAPEPGESPQRALEQGELRFTLEGERLRGRWVLVRLRDESSRRSGGRRNWLLIKRRGDEASGSKSDAASQSSGALPEDYSVASGRTMAQIAAGEGPAPRPFMMPGRRGAPNAVRRSDRGTERIPAGRTEDARVGARRKRMAASARVSVRSRGKSRAKSRSRADPFPAFVPPQLCRLVERPPSGPGWAHEIKFDGYRMQLRIEEGEVELKTRRGLDWTAKFPIIAAEARKFPDCLIDGEAVALDDRGAPSFPRLQAALSANDTSSVVFFAFDLLYAQGEDVRGAPLAERKRRLKALLDALAGHEHIRYVEHFEESADAVLKSACRMGLEGIVSKRLDAPYGSGRGEAWTKAKCRGGQEVVIAGWTSERNDLSSLLAGVWAGDRFIYVGRIGTGFSRETAQTLLRRLRPLEIEESPFNPAPRVPRARRIHWVRPQLAAEIEFAGWTTDGMIRQAAFKGIREDKPARQVTVERPARTSAIEQSVQNAAKRPAQNAASRRRRAGRTRADVSSGRPVGARSAGDRPTSDRPAGLGTVMGVEISHPDKPLWPHAGDGRPVTKLELAEYFALVGPWMMEHLRGRPCSLVRAPDGIDGEHFFQRHAMPGASSLFSLTRVSGDRKPYLQIDRVEGLAAAAQIAAIELHPWNCEPGRPDCPGRLVFDIDPAPDVPFAKVIAAAQELRDRLEAVGLAVFCKTTGGKGLHVVTPLAARGSLDWPAAKTFAQAVCAQMAADSPNRYSVKMSKRERAGRIFLDYLRNDRFATAVAPLSPRAREGATVSMPLEWPQVRAGLSPARFTLRTAPRLLEKGRPWKDYGSAARPLDRAIERLTGAGTAGRLAGGARRRFRHDVARAARRREGGR